LAPDDNSQPSNLGQAVSEVSERATLLIREEIELAKTEVFEKVSALVRGAVVGIAAGIFAVIGLLFLLIGAAFVFGDYVFDRVSFGFFIVAGVLFILGGLAGFLATKAFKKGSPPKPEMAIDEAKKIKETVTSGSEARV
jgi:hypothetical protein